MEQPPGPREVIPVTRRGLFMALRRSSRGAALAVLAAASLPWLLGGIGTTLGEMGAQDAIVKLGPAVTPKDLAAGNRQRLAAHYLGTLGTILAVCGGALALARSGD